MKKNAKNKKIVCVKKSGGRFRDGNVRDKSWTDTTSKKRCYRRKDGNDDKDDTVHAKLDGVKSSSG